MNSKRFVAATLAVFTFIILFELFLHDFMLMDFYEKTSSVWRDFDEMNPFSLLILVFKFALALWTVVVFRQMCPNGGLRSGLIFGLNIGILAGILVSNWYVWLPVPPQLAVGWFIGPTLEGLGAGFILGSLYPGNKIQRVTS